MKEPPPLNHHKLYHFGPRFTIFFCCCFVFFCCFFFFFFFFIDHFDVSKNRMRMILGNQKCSTSTLEKTMIFFKYDALVQASVLVSIFFLKISFFLCFIFFTCSFDLFFTPSLNIFMYYPYSRTTVFTNKSCF